MPKIEDLELEFRQAAGKGDVLALGGRISERNG